MAIKANLVMDQGADFSTTINLTDDNGDVQVLTGYSGAASMRKHYTSSTSYDFTVVVVPSLGTVTMTMTANATANIVAGRYVYDCEITDGSGQKSRLVEGIVEVTPRVTR